MLKANAQFYQEMMGQRAEQHVVIIEVLTDDQHDLLAGLGTLVLRFNCLFAQLFV